MKSRLTRRKEITRIKMEIKQPHLLSILLYRRRIFPAPKSLCVHLWATSPSSFQLTSFSRDTQKGIIRRKQIEAGKIIALSPSPWSCFGQWISQLFVTFFSSNFPSVSSNFLLPSSLEIRGCVSFKKQMPTWN